MNWISQNVVSLIFLLAALCAIAEFLWKPHRLLFSFVRYVWGRIARSEPLLHFVPITRESIFGAMPNAIAGQPTAQIVMHWTVTNASTSGMPAKLLEARLAKGRPMNLRLTYINTGSTDGKLGSQYDVIPPGTMRRLTLVFYGVLPADCLNKPIRANAIVMDNFSRQHRLRPMRLIPVTITPTNAPASPP